MASTELANEPQTAIRIEQVACRIGKRLVLDDIDLDIPSGEITGILGPNGAGKSTLLNIIIGLRKPSAGRVTVLGHESSHRNAEVSKRIGVVLQESALYDELTAHENLSFTASLYGIANPKERISQVLALLDMSERENERVGRLSGGQRRRITIARALLHSPDLLVIDEPTLGVDVEARHTIWSHLRVLRSLGVTVVASTNYLDEAVALCDTVAVLRAGRLIVTDTPLALVKREGSCLDIECDLEVIPVLEPALAGLDGVLRTRPTPTGLSVFLRGDSLPEPVVRAALAAASLRGFKLREADLLEVFHSLEEPSR
jgi:ABC-2 type transport system ATP-binding protein